MPGRRRLATGAFRAGSSQCCPALYHELGASSRWQLDRLCRFEQGRSSLHPLGAPYPLPSRCQITLRWPCWATRSSDSRGSAGFISMAADATPGPGWNPAAHSDQFAVAISIRQASPDCREQCCCGTCQLAIRWRPANWSYLLPAPATPRLFLHASARPRAAGRQGSLQPRSSIELSGSSVRKTQRMTGK